MLELFPVLRARARQTAETLSGGEQQMLAIARGLMSRPKLLMLDEMSLGLMPTLVEKMMETIVAINRSGMTVLLVEQMVQEALEIAHRGYVLQSRAHRSHGQRARAAGLRGDPQGLHGNVGWNSPTFQRY